LNRRIAISNITSIVKVILVFVNCVLTTLVEFY
jgi:hypothetical protein